jgi:hypothetical protein
MNIQGMRFNIVKHRGDPKEAQLESGHTVRRQEMVFVPQAANLSLPRWIKCTPYDNHFVYLDPVNEYGHWFAMCTCGSPAVIVNNMLVCYIHANTGRHVGDSRWV